MTHCFVIFRQARQACCARLPMPHVGGVISVGAHRFQQWRSFNHFHHIVDRDRRLLGFQLEFLDSPPDAAPWWRWVESCENCSYRDNEFTVLLAATLPKEYGSDCASIIGGDIFYDGSGEFIVTVPDMNNLKTPARAWSKVWDVLGFHLTELTGEPGRT